MNSKIILQALNSTFLFVVFFEIIFLIILPFQHEVLRFTLWSTLPFILLTGLISVYYKTVIHSIAFLIVNLSPIIIMLCNVINFNCDNNNYLVCSSDSSKFKSLPEDSEKEKEEEEEKNLQRYISLHRNGLIILGILQIIYIILCISLLKTKSWKWISKPVNRLNDEFKKMHVTYQYEELLFLIAISFLWIWIMMSEVNDIFKIDTKEIPELKYLIVFYNVLGIIIIIPISAVFLAIEKESVPLLNLFYFASFIEIVIIITRYIFIYFNKESGLIFPPNDITNRERLVFAILAGVSLIILNINTFLCQRNFGKKFNLLLAYNLEKPGKFGYNYDPKQDGESDDDESKDNNILNDLKEYFYYDQFKKEFLKFLN